LRAHCSYQSNRAIRYIFFAGAKKDAAPVPCANQKSNPKKQMLQLSRQANSRVKKGKQGNSPFTIQGGGGKLAHWHIAQLAH
jgi:hypothetical protein